MATFDDPWRFDPSGLDWSHYATPVERRPQGPGLHLSQAIERIGAAIVEVWNGHVFRQVSRAETPKIDIPDPDHAFEGGLPILEVHRAWGHAVRGLMSPGRARTLELKRTDLAAWVASHRLLEAGAYPIPESEIDAALGLDAQEPITYDTWLMAYVQGVMDPDMRIAAMASIDHAVHALTVLHRAGRIQLSSICYHDGSVRPVSPEVWHGEHEHRIRLIASCRYRLHPSAAIEAHLFVSETGFDEAVSDHAKDHRVPALPDDHPWLQEPYRKLGIRYPRLEAQVRKVLEPLLEKPEHDNWRIEDLEVIVSRHPDLGASYVQHIRAVREDFIHENLFKFLWTRGNLRKGLLKRPKIMNDGELHRLMDLAPGRALKLRTPIRPR